MDEKVEPAASLRWPWILWGLTTVFLGFLSIMADLAIRKLDLFYPEGMSLMTDLLLKWNRAVPFWFPVLAVSISGIPFARRGDTPRTQRWAAIVMFLTLLLVCVMMYALVDPVTRTNRGGLSR